MMMMMSQAHAVGRAVDPLSTVYCILRDYKKRVNTNNNR